MRQQKHGAHVQYALEGRGTGGTLRPVHSRLQGRVQALADLDDSRLGVEDADVLREEEGDDDELDGQHQDDHLVLGQVLATEAVVAHQPRPAQREENEGDDQQTLGEGLLGRLLHQFALDLPGQRLRRLAVFALIIKQQSLHSAQ